MLSGVVARPCFKPVGFDVFVRDADGPRACSGDELRALMETPSSRRVVGLEDTQAHVVASGALVHGPYDRAICVLIQPSPSSLNSLSSTEPRRLPTPATWARDLLGHDAEGDGILDAVSADRHLSLQR